MTKMSMFCHECHGRGIVTARSYRATGGLWRRRKCKLCDARWSTIETRIEGSEADKKEDDDQESEVV